MPTRARVEDGALTRLFAVPSADLRGVFRQRLQMVRDRLLCLTASVEQYQVLALRGVA
jgi:hypothetical protein